MPGEIRKILDKIISERAKGSPVLANTTKTKLILKGLNPDKYSTASPDDPEILSKARKVAAELGVRL